MLDGMQKRNSWPNQFMILCFPIRLAKTVNNKAKTNELISCLFDQDPNRCNSLIFSPYPNGYNCLIFFRLPLLPHSPICVFSFEKVCKKKLPFQLSVFYLPHFNTIMGPKKLKVPRFSDNSYNVIKKQPLK